MSAYLKRLQIGSVEEVGVETTNSAYLKRVEIVEVVDSDGQPWEPVPGPDPWDELVVGMPSQWADHNNYVEGEEIYADPAQFTGGSDQVIYRYRWQTKDPGSQDWINGSWTTYHGALEVHTAAPAGTVRLQSQARDDADDPVTVVNSFSSAQCVLSVSGDFNVNGDEFAGEDVVCGTPTVTSCAPGNTTKVYTWSNGAVGQKIKVQAADVGSNLSCTVTVTDSNGNTVDVTSQNSIGPIGQYTLGALQPTVDGVAYDPQSTVQDISESGEVLISITPTGDSPNIEYDFEVRQGQARLQTTFSSCIVTNQTAAGMPLAIHAKAQDYYAAPDQALDVRFQFITV